MVNATKKRIGECVESEIVTLIDGREVCVISEEYDYMLVINQETGCEEDIPKEYFLKGALDNLVWCVCPDCDNGFYFINHDDFFPDHCCYCSHVFNWSIDESDG